MDMDEKILTTIADFCAGTISHEDMERLEEWLREVPENKALFKEYFDAHRAAMETSLDRSLDEHQAWRKLSRRLTQTPARRRTRLWVVSAAAAVVVVAVGLWGLLIRDGGTQEVLMPGRAQATLMLDGGRTVALDEGSRLSVTETEGIVLERDSTRDVLYCGQTTPTLHTVEVPRGGEFSFTLPDGSLVRLNSDTRLTFPSHFPDSVREVYLEGEAFLEVAPQPGRPFVLNTDYGSVTVLGTVFNVYAYPEEHTMVTSLVSGSVEVGIGGRRALLASSEQAVWHEGASGIEVRTGYVGSATAWVDGNFEFEDLSLGEILTYLSRWYDMTFEFDSPATAGLRFTGGAKKYAPLDDFLGVIESSYDIEFTRKGTHIKVSGPGKR